MCKCSGKCGCNITQITKGIKGDTGGVAPTYKVYTAIATNDGLNPPIITVLENTLSGTPVWGGLAGSWTITLNGAFTVGKTFVIVGGNDVTAGGDGLAYSIDYSASPNVLGLNIFDFLGATAFARLYNTPIEIRVYP